MRETLKKKSLLGVLALFGGFAISAAIDVQASFAQQLTARTETENPTQAVNLGSTAPGSKSARRSSVQYPYYVDFRARTAASYGHAFVWYGRASDRKVEVAGLHPAGESTVPYVLGHVLPVPSETGASYGDLDVQYLTANYRVYLSEPDAKRVFAYIKQLQKTSPVWNAMTFNCTAFLGKIANYMGLKTPYSHLLVPEDWVNNLREINDARKTVQLAPEQNQ